MCVSELEPPPIDAPCTQWLRHGDPMSARKQLTCAALLLLPHCTLGRPAQHAEVGPRRRCRPVLRRR
jgi:hypothetical protein